MTRKPWLLGVLLICAAVAGTYLMRMKTVHADDEKKKGGQSCEKNRECETGVCDDGKCDPCPSADNCPPPGTCYDDPDGYREKRAKVSKYCKQEQMSCDSIAGFNNDDANCSELKKRLDVSSSCVAARDDINNSCFKGGDDGHKEARENAAEVRNHCKDLIDYKKGRNICFTCDEGELGDLKNRVGDICTEDNMRCAEPDDDESKVDCDALEKKIEAAHACLEIHKELADTCFNGEESEMRRAKQQQASEWHDECQKFLDDAREHHRCHEE